MNASTDWMTAVAVLAAGVILGLMVIYFVRRKTVVPPALRAGFVGFAAGVVSTLLVGGFAYSVKQPPKAVDVKVAPGALQQLEAAVQKSPEDLNARVELAKAYLDQNNLMGVFDQTQYVLAKSPNDSRALTYQAVVRVAMGQREDAVKMLEKATKTDPNLVDAWVATAWLKTQEGKPKDAEAAITEAARRHPEEKHRLEETFAQMKQQVSAPPSELPPGHPPIGRSAAKGEDGVQIVLDLDPSAKSKSGVVFVLVRQDGVTSGPPIAVKRLQTDSFPMTFVMTAADSMMGQPLPAKMRIEARLDTDGDVVTKSPNEPYGVQDGVATGSTINLALK
jgi:cytochrome c-type biogenesis protein CcmH